MTTFHAVVRIDHQNAEILQFDAEHVQAQKLKAHTHHTGQHGSQVRTEHEFFGQVCDALAGIAEVLVAGAHTAQSDFQPLRREAPAGAGAAHRRLRDRRPARPPASWWRWRASSS